MHGLIHLSGQAKERPLSWSERLSVRFSFQSLLKRGHLFGQGGRVTRMIVVKTPHCWSFFARYNYSRHLNVLPRTYCAGNKGQFLSWQPLRVTENDMFLFLSLRIWMFQRPNLIMPLH